MERFDTRRQNLLTAIHGLRSIAELLVPTDRALQALLDQAQKLVEQSAVNLVVLGAEGHGKSSLVDAIIGADIVPCEAQHPGTVAPVLVQWHDGEEPTYAVGLNGSDAPTPCGNAEQFRRFILQRFNPSNERGVGYGLVKYQHPLLADGLCLVDMPGLEGVSEEVNAALRAYIAAAEAVIIVIRDRQYGAAGRLLEAFGDRDVHIQAVVSNWSLDFWITDSDPELAERINAQRTILADYLRTDHLAIDPQRVFVLHVPSIRNCELAPDATVSRAPHVEEIQRFGAWITHYLDADRVTGLLDQTIAHLHTAIAMAQRRVERYAHTLDCLLRDDQDIQHKSLRTLQDITNHLLSQWPQLAASHELNDLIERNWNMLHGKLRECRDAILAAVNRAQTTLLLLPADQWSNETVHRFARELRTTVEHALQQLEQAHSDAILAVVERLRALADRYIVATFETVPVVPGRLDAIHIEGPSLVDLTHPCPDPERFLEIFSNRRIVDRILDAYRTQAQAINTSRHGLQGHVYDQNIQAARDAFREALRLRLSHKADGVADPTSQACTDSRELLADVHAALQHLAVEISSLTTAPRR